MFGVEVPNGPPDAKFLDARNKNTKWKDSVAAEMHTVVREYGVSEDLGEGAEPPEGYQFVPTALVRAVKHDL